MENIILKHHTTIAGETSGKTEAYQDGHEVWNPCMEFLWCFPAHNIQFEKPAQVKPTEC